MDAREEPLIKRYSGNPILTKQQVPYTVETVHNAAVVRHRDSYLMVFRSHLRNGRSILGVAESRDGFNFQVRPKPFSCPGHRPCLRALRGIWRGRPQNLFPGRGVLDHI